MSPTHSNCGCKADDFVQPYSPMVYGTVTQSLGAAIKKLEHKNAIPVLNTKIRDCFLEHGIEKTFSACLIHKHFPLADDERNIEVDGKAVASSDLEGICPSTWIFHDGKCYPMEYKRTQVPQPPKDFVKDLGKLLQDAGLTDVFGFQVYTDGVVGLESTQDKISTTVEQDEKMPTPEGMAAASWAFFRV